MLQDVNYDGTYNSSLQTSAFVWWCSHSAPSRHHVNLILNLMSRSMAKRMCLANTVSPLICCLRRLQSVCLFSRKEERKYKRWARGTELPFSGKQVNSQVVRKHVNQITLSTAIRLTASDNLGSKGINTHLVGNPVNYEASDCKQIAQPNLCYVVLWDIFLFCGETFLSG
jgi:hypothetical protein